MKKWIILIITLPIFAIATDCDPYYHEGFYLNLFGGASFAHHQKIEHKTKIKTGYVAGGSLGYITPWRFRLEGEMAYRRHMVKENGHGHFSSLAYMGNLIVDNPLEFWMRPYIGAGIGYAHNLQSIREKGSHDKNGFAWQALGGFAFYLLRWVDLNIEYRYFQPNVAYYHSQNVIGGLRFHY